MRLPTLLRATFAWAVLPVAALLTVLFTGVAEPATPGYALAAQVAMAQSAGLVMPLVCLTGAMIGRRFALALRARMIRRPLGQIVLTHLALPTVAAVVAVLGAVALAPLWNGGRAALDPRLAGVVAVAAAAYAVLGLALGLRLPLVLAGPVALALPFLVIAFPPAVEPLWLRHLTWVDTDCCTIGQVLGSRALMVVTGTCLAFLAAGAMIVFHLLRGSRVSQWLLGVAAVLLLGSAVNAAPPLAARFTAARPGEPRCTVMAQVQACLWPEHEPLRGQVERVAGRVASVSRATGAALPQRLTETDDATWPAVSLPLSLGADDASVTKATAEALAHGLPRGCEPGDQGDATSTERADRQLAVEMLRTVWWLTRLGRVADAQTYLSISSDVQAAYRRLTALPMPRQVAWLERTGAQLRACQDVRLLSGRQGEDPLSAARASPKA